MLSIPKSLQDLPKNVELISLGTRWGLRYGHLMVPSRHDEMYVSPQGEVAIRTGRRTVPQIIDYVPREEIGRVINTVQRELAIRLAGRKDIDIVANSTCVTSFYTFLQRIAGDRSLRLFVQEIFRQEGTKIRTRVRESEKKEMEEANRYCHNLYGRCLGGLAMTKEEQELIQFLSWEWKSGYATYPYYCRMWILISACFNLLYIPKKRRK